MSARVVCISRTLGSGAEEIGSKVAEQLGFRTVDDEIVDRAARMVQVDPGVVAKAENRQPLVDRILEWLSRPSGTSVRGGLSAEQAPALVTEDYRAIIRGVVYETAKKGDVVNHGARGIHGVVADCGACADPFTTASEATRAAVATAQTLPPRTLAIWDLDVRRGPTTSSAFYQIERNVLRTTTC
jgi:hypothetical protein